MNRFHCLVVIGFSLLASSALAQNPAPAFGPSGGRGGSGRGQRPAVAPRDPHTEGYVTAKELPDGAIPSPKEDGNFILGPTHPAAPEMKSSDSVPKGRIVNFTMESTDSKIYPGIMRGPAPGEAPAVQQPGGPRVVQTHPAPYSRKVAVFIPAQYVAGSVAPFMLGADGPDPRLFTAMENLIAQKRIPVMIGISVQNGGGDAQGSERGLEYDTVSGLYAQFIETEVLPRVEKEADVKLTKDPDARATMGVSSSAAAALSMAWYRNDLYHRVLSYSGTFVNQQWPVNPETLHGAWEFHEHIIPNSPVKPIRIWMEVGDKDLLISNDGYHDWVIANENMAKVLTAKGYHYQYSFARNAGHVDRDTVAQTLPEALEYVWQGYRASGK